jgi:DNA helicase HerA-like ATPase
MDRNQVIHIGRVDFRNDRRAFGIKDEDRFSHIYIIGKTGAGKSTLMEMMAPQDMERGNGFALIDPHGDLVARIGRNNVIYLNATDQRSPTATTPSVTLAKIASPWRLPA